MSTRSLLAVGENYADKSKNAIKTPRPLTLVTNRANVFLLGSSVSRSARGPDDLQDSKKADGPAPKSVAQIKQPMKKTQLFLCKHQNTSSKQDICDLFENLSFHTIGNLNDLTPLPVTTRSPDPATTLSLDLHSPRLSIDPLECSKQTLHLPCLTENTHRNLLSSDSDASELLVPSSFCSDVTFSSPDSVASSTGNRYVNVNTSLVNSPDTLTDSLILSDRVYSAALHSTGDIDD